MGDEDVRKVLVIDDDPDFIEFVTIVLESAGHTVHTATNAESGIEALQEHIPDLVILDVMMSYELGGWNVSREMSADPELCNIPVLMVSAIVSDSDEDSFPNNGKVRLDAFMRKPLDPADLLQRVAQLTGGDEQGGAS